MVRMPLISTFFLGIENRYKIEENIPDPWNVLLIAVRSLDLPVHHSLNLLSFSLPEPIL